MNADIKFSGSGGYNRTCSISSTDSCYRKMAITLRMRQWVDCGCIEDILGKKIKCKRDGIFIVIYSLLKTNEVVL